MKRITVLTAIAAALMLFAAQAHAPAASLWTETSDSLYSDQKALYVGDLVTIVVSERTSATQNASTNIEQQEQMEGEHGENLLSKFLENFEWEANDEYDADGRTAAGSTLNTTISAEVVEILPNGNLVIEARRSLVVNEETQTMILSGLIRSQDVVRDNRVSSQRIANLSIRYQGKGPISNRQRPGFLNKLFNMIF